jgi:hypothetical protein
MKKEDARASESNRLDGVSRRRRARGARVSPPSRHLVADGGARRAFLRDYDGIVDEETTLRVAGVGGSIGSASSSSVDGARPTKKCFNVGLA